MAVRYVVYEIGGEIHTVAEKADDVLTISQTRVAVDESIVPAEHPSNYTFDGVAFIRKAQAVIDAINQQILDEKEAKRLMQIEIDDLAAKEAKKIFGLSQGVIDELTKKEKKL